MPYTKREWGWQDREPAASLSGSAFRLLPHLTSNRLMNRAALYKASPQTLAAIARMTVDEVKEALAELVEREIILYDEENFCLFVVGYIDEAYVKEGQLKRDTTVAALVKDIARCADMSLYPMLLKAYPELVELVPEPGAPRRARRKGVRDQP